MSKFDDIANQILNSVPSCRDWLHDVVNQGKISQEIMAWLPAASPQTEILGYGLALLAELETNRQGVLAGRFLLELIRQPLRGDSHQWDQLAGYLLAYAFWEDARKMVKALEGASPISASWLKLNLALEYNQSPQAKEEFQRLLRMDVEKADDGRLAEAAIRLALLEGTEADDQWLEHPVAHAGVKARYWLGRGNLNAAEAALNVISGAIVHDPLILWPRATLAAHRGDKGTALSCWNDAISMRPRLVGLRVDRGRFRLFWGDTQGGGEDIELAIKLKPWVGKITLPWVARLTERGDYNRALNILDYSLAAHPEQPDLVAALLDVLRAKKDHARALAVGERAIAHFPNNGDVWVEWGNTLLMLGRRDAAITAYRRAMTLGQAGVARSNLAKLLFDEGDIDEAIALWQDAVRESPDDPIILINLAQALLKRGDQEDALEQFESVRMRHPKTAAALRGVAECKLALGDLDEAEKTARAALDLSPNEVQSYLIMAAVLKVLGQEKAVLTTLEGGLPRVSRPLPLQQAIWRILIQRREYAGALQRVTQAAQTHPEEIE